MTRPLPVRTNSAIASVSKSEVEELRASRVRLVLAELAAREEIERALHQGVQQRLVALAVELQLAIASADPETRSALEELAGDLQEAQDEAARLALRIHPPLLAERGLGLALRSVAENARVEIRGVATPSPAAVSVVYLCVLEILGHVGDGPPATVTVTAEESGLAFEIVTRRTTAVPSSELEPVRDRLEALGGELAVSFRRDGDLTLSGRVPSA